MTDRQQWGLGDRWDAANKRLAELHAAGKLNEQEPSEEEQQLLAELDHVEYEVGLEYLNER
jgi:hypothetical protein